MMLRAAGTPMMTFVVLALPPNLMSARRAVCFRA
jgi:hypothetical protein